MVKSFTVRVDHPPKVKQRPRLGRRRKAYTPAATLEAEELIAMAWRRSDGPMFEGPVSMRVEYDKLGQTITVQEAQHTSKMRGDLDNYIKLSLDGLNGVAFADDKQIVHLNCSKH